MFLNIAVIEKHSRTIVIKVSYNTLPKRRVVMAQLPVFLHWTSTNIMIINRIERQKIEQKEKSPEISVITIYRIRERDRPWD